MFTVAICIQFFYSDLFCLLSPPSSLFLFFFFLSVSLPCAALSPSVSSQRLSLLCSLSLISGNPICGGGCLRTASFWWVGGCHGIQWRGFGFAGVGIVGLGGPTWVWVYRHGLWWVWVVAVSGFWVLARSEFWEETRSCSATTWEKKVIWEGRRLEIGVREGD